MKNNSWTDKKVEKLKKYLAKGLTTSEIGKKLDLSKNAVIGKIHRLKLNETIKKETPAKKPSLFKSLSIKKTPEKTAKKASPKAKKEGTKKATKAKTLELPLGEAPAKEAKKAVKKTTKSTKKETTSEEKEIKVIEKPATKKASAPASTGKGYKLQDIGFNMCKWPLEEGDEDGNFLFCGCQTEDKKQYCAEHLAEAYVQQDDKK
ncbi:MAG: hypothetical protein N4A44_02940 [Alphaproteobacteria bacterium]|jgi:GcrA cell cycle regulator|nr:hypothetical protein [Alphaproteobacteria bacterium]